MSATVQGGQDAYFEQINLADILNLSAVEVSGASRYAQRVSDAPSSITILSARDLERFGYRTLAEALQSVRGFYTTYDRTYNYAGIRGFCTPGDYNTRLLLLINGLPVNDNVYGSAAIGTDFNLDLSAVERIEIIRGPSSSLYGTSAFFGVINVITRTGAGAPGVRAGIDAGSFMTVSGNCALSRDSGRGPMLYGMVQGHNTIGPDLYYEEMEGSRLSANGHAQGTDFDRSVKSFGQLAHGGFSSQAAVAYRNKGIPTGVWGTEYGDPGNQMTDLRAHLATRYEQPLGTGLFATGELWYNHYNYFGDYVYLDDSVDPSTAYTNFDKVYGKQVNLNLRIRKHHRDNLTVIAGTEGQINVQQDQWNADEGAENTVRLDDQRATRNAAAFIQAEWCQWVLYRARIILNAGLRADWYQTFGATVNPRLALIVQPSNISAIKLLYGTAFRAPNMYELYYDDGGNYQKSNPALQAEKIATYELAAEFSPHRFVSLSGAGFFYTLDKLISQQIDPLDSLLVFDNADAANAFGVEAECALHLPRGIAGSASYTLQVSRDRHSGLALTNVPRHMVKLRLSVPVIDTALSINPEILFESPRGTLAGQDTEPVYLINLTFHARPLHKTRRFRGVSIAASVYNLLDYAYAHPGSGEHYQNTLRQDGRTLRIRIDYAGSIKN